MSRRLPILLMSLFLMLSCAEKENAPGHRNPSVPHFFSEFMEAIGRGCWYSSAEDAEDYLIITFDDGTVVDIPHDEVKIIDGNIFDQPSVFQEDDSGEWLRNRVYTGLYFEDVPDGESYPLCIWFDGQCIKVYLCNGSVIVRGLNPSEQKRVFDRLPLVYISTTGEKPIADKVNYISGTLRVEDSLGEYSPEAVFEAPMRIKGRGNSTWDFFPKKPYHIKLDEKANVLGLPKNKDWIVLANYNDKSLLRNDVGMELSRICGLSWTPAFYPVELYLNGEYMGVYEFGDHKEVAKHRVDIADDDFYLELECYPDEPYNFWTDMSVPLTIKNPEAPTTAQINNIKQFFAEFEAALQSDRFGDSDVGYAKYIDVKSFVDNYIIEELTKNYDGNLHKSSFFTKQTDGKLEVYHVWDFDLSLGNCNFFQNYGLGNGPESFFVKDYGFQGRGWGWYCRLFQDPAFRKMVKDRWNELKPQLDAVPDFIRERAEYLDEAAGRNFERWDILSTNVWSQYAIPGTYKGEVGYLLYFYNTRLDWLDTEINKW